MPRPLRIEYAGARYHVMSRGDRREAIYHDDADRVGIAGRLRMRSASYISNLLGRVDSKLSPQFSARIRKLPLACCSNPKTSDTLRHFAELSDAGKLKITQPRIIAATRKAFSTSTKRPLRNQLDNRDGRRVTDH